MILKRLRIEQFRCIGAAELNFATNRGAILGPNGAGKTSILEAIHFVTRGRSFRQPRADRLVQHGMPWFRLVADLDLDSVSHRVGVELGRGHQQIRIDGKAVDNLAEINRQVVVEVVEPEIHRLISEGPEGRRRFIDYGVFHVEQGYLDAWRRYRKVLKQRNAALRTQQPVAVWEAALVEAAATVDGFRSGYIKLLAPAVAEALATLNMPGVLLEYRPGWKEGLTMGEALRDAEARDRELGTTSVGPHRADLKILWDGRLAREQVSRGQQKLLAAGLVLAQTRLLAEINHGQSILLVDDPAAELDASSLERLMQLIGEIPGQLILTAIDAELPILQGPSDVFHVKQGVVNPAADHSA